MPLQPGAQAPDVTLVSHTNQPVSLGDYRGKQPVVILFFPLAFTSTCTAELCAVRDDIGSYEDLESEVFAVSVDSPFALKRFREETGAPYTFLSDFHREAAQAFDVLRTAPLRAWVAEHHRSFRIRDRPGWQDRLQLALPNPSLIPPFDEIKDAPALASRREDLLHFGGGEVVLFVAEVAHHLCPRLLLLLDDPVHFFLPEAHDRRLESLP